MKKLFPIFILLMLANLIAAQVSKTVSITIAGTLSGLLTSTEKTTITDLSVIGTIDARDIQCMRDELTLLANLNLSGVNITAYTGSETYSPSNLENQLPVMSFYRMSPEFKKTTLRSIILPTSITDIGMLSFYGCSSLETIVCMINTPPTANNMAFYGISPTIYIPYGKTTTYRAVKEWQNFNYIEGSGTTGGTDNFSSNNNINIYPNPVKTELKIDFEKGSQFNIQNLSGQIVFTGDLTESSVIQTSHLSTGVYLIKFQMGKTFEYKKFVKE